MIHFSSWAQKLGWSLRDHSPHVAPYNHPASLFLGLGPASFSLDGILPRVPGYGNPSTIGWQLARHLPGPQSLVLPVPPFPLITVTLEFRVPVSATVELLHHLFI